MITNYKNLLVWQKAINLVILIYKLTDNFPKIEQFSITNQIRRSAVSIPSNIAEGRMRITKKEFRKFLLIAYGSGAELETQLEISKKLRFGEEKEYKIIEDLLAEIMKILNTITYKLRS